MPLRFLFGPSRLSSQRSEIFAEEPTSNFATLPSTRTHNKNSSSNIFVLHHKSTASASYLILLGGPSSFSGNDSVRCRCKVSAEPKAMYQYCPVSPSLPQRQQRNGAVLAAAAAAAAAAASGPRDPNLLLRDAAIRAAVALNNRAVGILGSYGDGGGVTAADPAAEESLASFRDALDLMKAASEEEVPGLPFPPPPYSPPSVDEALLKETLRRANDRLSRPHPTCPNGGEPSNGGSCFTILSEECSEDAFSAALGEEVDSNEGGGGGSFLVRIEAYGLEGIFSPGREFDLNCCIILCNYGTAFKHLARPTTVPSLLDPKVRMTPLQKRLRRNAERLLENVQSLLGTMISGLSAGAATITEYDGEGEMYESPLPSGDDQLEERILFVSLVATGSLLDALLLSVPPPGSGPFHHDERAAVAKIERCRERLAELGATYRSVGDFAAFLTPSGGMHAPGA